jgi:hypothetical protein
MFRSPELEIELINQERARHLRDERHYRDLRAQQAEGHQAFRSELRRALSDGLNALGRRLAYDENHGASPPSDGLPTRSSGTRSIETR